MLFTCNEQESSTLSVVFSGVAAISVIDPLNQINVSFVEVVCVYLAKTAAGIVWLSSPPVAQNSEQTAFFLHCHCII